MNVPTDLLDKDIKLATIDGVYVKKYTESENNKIYTHLEKNLLVFVLKGIKKVKANDYSEIVEEENYIFLKKDNLVMNQILNYVDKNYESLLIFIENKCIYELLKIYDDSDYTNISKAKGYYLGNTSDEMGEKIKKIIQLVNDKEKYSHNIISLKVKELMIYIAQNDKTNEFRNILK